MFSLLPDKYTVRSLDLGELLVQQFVSLPLSVELLSELSPLSHELVHGEWDADGGGEREPRRQVSVPVVARPGPSA